MIYDITFVGSGMACVTTLTELCTSLLKTGSLLKKPLNIAVIEKQSQFWAGLPYGDKSSVNCLTITTYAEFLNDPDKFDEFNNWLKQDNHSWITEYLALGGSTAAKWYKRNKNVIDAGEIATIAIPRYLYGKFIRQQLQELVAAAEQRGLVTLKTISGEAVAAGKIDGSNFVVDIKTGEDSIIELCTRKLVLTTGNMPFRKVEFSGNVSAERFIQSAYEPDMAHNLQSLEFLLRNTTNTDERNLLLVGSNAASIELLYLLGNHEEFTTLVNKIVVLSPGGKLPLAAVDTKDDKQFIFFDKLKNTSNCTPELVFDAMMKEFGKHFKNEVCTSTVQKLLQQTRQLLSYMSEVEFSHFLMSKGPEFSKFIRRSVADYLQTVIRLKTEGRLVMLQGKLVSLSSEGGENNTPLVLQYKNGNDVITYGNKFSAVIGCSGFGTFGECTCPLINDVLAKGLCQINTAGIGIEVDKNFEATENFYVTGPLVAGTVNEVLHYWHLENLSRLLQLAPYLSASLLRDFTI
ncbi:hypothetical protein DJ568_10350 [Mucilaginibacter hurinus]|uniref:FAD-dependent urate hydroxylase HpyO/Asp monooxygenase CreE-like FAD/NAD(P)-binding domain-containing protein n=1 Tax=Mucilaginibacter hurinus TaxID=2201324 RepID=A0A367GN00_9SPHI|nr:FAD/NAD(P)-binding protein [Mucilaginibacter hurinus]RCH54872.1 hypothetical protein DJ568_10350 [Mucilaginibacter hurinus]